MVPFEDIEARHRYQCEPLTGIKVVFRASCMASDLVLYTGVGAMWKAYMVKGCNGANPLNLDILPPVSLGNHSKCAHC